MGILGTSAGLVSDLSLIFEVVILSIITFAWLKARSKESNLHHNMTILATILNVLFVLSYMIKSYVESPPTFQGPDSIRVGVYLPVVIVHGLVSTIVLILSLVLIYISIKGATKEKRWVFSKEKRPKHKKMGVLMFLMWYIAMITGIIVYVLLYMAYPQPV
jgi:putative membrane protein